MVAMLRAMSEVRDGHWIRGAPTHVLAEFLTTLRRNGWLLIRADLLTTTDKLVDDCEALRAQLDKLPADSMPYEVSMRLLEARDSISDYVKHRKKIDASTEG